VYTLGTGRLALNAQGEQMTTHRIRLALALLAGIAAVPPRAYSQPMPPPDGTETIVMVRHGEKPAAGLGQLNCQGLNRALALPVVLEKQFGKPAAIFAPNPSEQKSDDGKMYDYIRPLATIEPAAIAWGMPVNAGIGQSKTDELNKAITAPKYRDAYVLVGWEHTMATRAASALMKQFGGDPATVPDWKGNDFDSIYIVRIDRVGPVTKARFQLAKEGLDGQPATCPGAATHSP
jgi:hypothetical protein